MQLNLHEARAVVHGGGGAIGGAIARVLAREGAWVFLTGRTLERQELVASQVRRAGGRAEVAALDVLDERATEAHADGVAARAGGIDVMVNAIGMHHVQGVGLAALTLANFIEPINGYLRANFNAAKAAGRHMAARRRGVILTLSVPGARLVGPGWLGHGSAFAGVEAFTRLLAAELGPSGVRVVCLRPDAIPEAVRQGSHARDVFEAALAGKGTTVDALLAERARSSTLTGYLPKLEDVAETAAFFASDRARAFTGTVANLTCGSVVE